MTETENLLIRIQGIAGGRCACRVLDGKTIINLLSPVHAGTGHGAAWFATLLQDLRRSHPHHDIRGWLDCRGRLSSALAAFELGLSAVIVDPPSEAYDQRLESLADKSGTRLLTTLPADMSVHEMQDDILPEREQERRLRTCLGL